MKKTVTIHVELEVRVEQEFSEDLLLPGLGDQLSVMLAQWFSDTPGFMLIGVPEWDLSMQ